MSEKISSSSLGKKCKSKTHHHRHRPLFFFSSSSFFSSSCFFFTTDNHIREGKNNRSIKNEMKSANRCTRAHNKCVLLQEHTCKSVFLNTRTFTIRFLIFGKLKWKVQARTHNHNFTAQRPRERPESDPRAARERPSSSGAEAPRQPGKTSHLRPSHHLLPTTAARIVTSLWPFVQKEGLRFISIIMPPMPCQQKNNKNQKLKKITPAWLPRPHNTDNTIKFYFTPPTSPLSASLSPEIKASQSPSTSWSASTTTSHSKHFFHYFTQALKSTFKFSSSKLLVGGNWVPLLNSVTWPCQVERNSILL